MCNKQRFWPILCDAIGRCELADDPRFNDFSVRLENRKLLEALLDEVLIGRTTKEWLAVGVPVMIITCSIASIVVALFYGHFETA